MKKLLRELFYFCSAPLQIVTEYVYLAGSVRGGATAFVTEQILSGKSGSFMVMVTLFDGIVTFLYFR